jgi:hypothetical protein
MPEEILSERPTWHFRDAIGCEEGSGEEYVERFADGAFLDFRFEGTRQAQKKNGKPFLIADVVRENPLPYDADEDEKEYCFPLGVILEDRIAKLVAGDKVRVVYCGEIPTGNHRYYSNFRLFRLKPGEGWEAMNDNTLREMKASAQSRADKSSGSTLGNEMDAEEEDIPY